MSAALRYLEEAKIEELAHKYEEQGFAIAKHHQDAGATYDLVASNGQKTIAIEVKARTALARYVEEIKRLRTIAHDRGYDFHLIIVNPPVERQIRVDGFRPLLLRYITGHLPDLLGELSDHATIETVKALDIKSIEVTRAGLDLKGTGAVEVTLDYAIEGDRDGVAWEMTFPFDFALSISPQFEITEVDQLLIDTSEFTG